MSWKFEVHGVGDPPDHYVTNALRFATKQEADDYGWDLGARWTGIDDGRAVECSDAVSHRWTGKLVTL